MITVGIDEVGRGCWAGPLVAGAVILPAPIEGLTDSKLLAPVRRQQLDALIREQAAFGLGWVEAAELDQIGLTAAVRLAMRRALAAITVPFDEVVIDGAYNFLSDEPRARTLIKADLLVPAVSAASVLAKVARDTYMQQTAARKFPVYGFEKHVGYGTAAHRAALSAHGPCLLHRRSFKPVAAFFS